MVARDKYAEAGAMDRQMLELMETVLEKSVTLGIMNNLAIAAREAGQVRRDRRDAPSGLIVGTKYAIGRKTLITYLK